MRGIVYSMILMLLFTSLALFALTFLEFMKQSSSETVVGVRGRELASFSQSIYVDLSRVLGIVAKKALIAADEYVISNGTGLDNAQERLVELMENKSIYGEPYLFMNTDSLVDWAQKMDAGGESRGFVTNITVVSLNVVPVDSFKLNFSATVFLDLREKQGLMNLSRNYSQSILIDVEGLEDPIQPMKTNGFVKKIIAKQTEGLWGVARVEQATLSGWYLSSSDGASFFDRLEGRITASDKYRALSPNPIGLETLVNVQEISSKGIPVKENQSIVDYYYFNDSTITGYPLNGSSYSWIKLDEEHAAKYGVRDDLLK
jgi:hypothetical protein